MSKNKYYLVVGILGLAISTLAVSSLVSAHDGFLNNPNLTDEQKAQIQEKREEMQANHEEMKQIMEDGDYDAWAAQMTEKVEKIRAHADDLEGKITPETFQALQQAHQLMQDGDREGAKEIMQELGLKGPHPFFKGYKKGLRHGMNIGQE